MTDYHRLYDAIAAGTAEVAVPRWAAGFLRAVLDGTDPTPALCHPLGFYCFPAWRGAAGHGICLHVWPDTAERSAVRHAHSWDLVSYVLYGRVRNDIIELTEGIAHRVFEVHSGPDGDALVRTERLADCRVLRSEHHGPGAVYTLPAGIFHTSTVTGEAATVALGRHWAEHRDLSLLDPVAPDHHTTRRACTPIETRAIARAVHSRMPEDACPW
ncbi:hypothetical protein D5S17_11290 [Pseudonocardiaceae bacterium YIM PH 21723]|nr:hypothetical protein D5S17_11290 [Pseudonocardiaceae bacterium YIM PH 21723]